MKIQKRFYNFIKLFNSFFIITLLTISSMLLVAQKGNADPLVYQSGHVHASILTTVDTNSIGVRANYSTYIGGRGDLYEIHYRFKRSTSSSWQYTRTVPRTAASGRQTDYFGSSATPVDTALTGLSAGVYDIEVDRIYQDGSNFRSLKGGSLSVYVPGSDDPIDIIVANDTSTGNIDVTVNIASQLEGLISLSDVVLYIKPQGAGSFTELSSIASSPYSWPASSHTELQGLRGGYTLKAIVNTTETMCGSCGPVNYSREKDITVVNDIPLIIDPAFTMNITQDSQISGDLIVETNYTHSYTLDSVELSIRLNQSGPYISVGNIPIGPVPNSIKWCYASLPSCYSSYPSLVVADGTHSFKISGPATDSGTTYTMLAESSFTVSTFGSMDNPLPVDDAFTFAITEQNGDLTITLTQVDPLLNAGDIDLYMTAPGGSEEQVGTISPSGLVTIWDPTTFPKLSELEQGLYNFRAESLAYDSVTGIYTLMRGNIDFFVVGNLFTFIVEELTFGNLGVEVEVEDPSGTVNAVKLYIKPKAAADSEYKLVREETGGAPYQWGSKNPSISDEDLEKMLGGDYTLKAETTIPDPNGGPNPMVIVGTHDVSVIGVPIEFIKVEDRTDVGIEVLATNPGINSIAIELKKLSQPDSAYVPLRGRDPDGNLIGDNFSPYLFGVLDNFNDDPLLLGMDMGMWNARVTVIITLQGTRADYPPNPLLVLVGEVGGPQPTVTFQYTEVFEFEVDGSVDDTLRARLNEIYTREFKFKVKVENNDDPNVYLNANKTDVQLVTSGVLNDQISYVTLRVTDPSGVQHTLGTYHSQNPNDWVWKASDWGILNQSTPGRYILNAEINLGGPDKSINKIEPFIKSNEIKDNSDPNVTDDNLLGDRLGTFKLNE